MFEQGVNVPAYHSRRGCKQEAVLVDVVQFAENPEQIIPTLVRFARVESIECILPGSVYASTSLGLICGRVVSDEVIDLPWVRGSTANTEADGLIRDMI